MAKVAPSTSPSKIEKFSMLYHGKEFRIYRVPPKLNWRIDVTKEGKRYPKSLGTPIKNVAVRQAKIFLDTLFSEGWEEKLPHLRYRSVTGTAFKVACDYYKTHAPAEARIKYATATTNIGAFRRLLECNFPQRDPWTIPLTEIQDSHILTFVRDLRQRGHTEISIGSTIGQAHGIFARKLKSFYRHGNIDIPENIWALDWNIGGARRPSDPHFVPIPAEIVWKMEEAAKSLPPNLRRAYLLMARLGCRNKEVMNAKRGWIEVQNGRRLFIFKDRSEEAFELKNHESAALPITDDLWAELSVDLPEDPDGYLINLSRKQRKILIYTKLSQFVRQFLPDRQKSSYELRKLAGSIIITRTRNPYLTQKFLRHKRFATTEQNYATFLDIAPSITGEDLTSLFAPPTAPASDPAPPASGSGSAPAPAAPDPAILAVPAP